MTTATAPAPAAAKYVVTLTYADGTGPVEHARYTTTQAARRAGKKLAATDGVADFTVRHADEWDAEQDTAAAEQEAADREARTDAAFGRYATRRNITARRRDVAARRRLRAVPDAAPAPYVPERLPEPDEMTGTDWPELAPRRDRAAEYEARNAEYAARTEQGPMVYVRDAEGEYQPHRRYECATRAARAARGMATRQKRAQQAARVVATDGTVLLDTETDELVAQARQDGEVLTGLRPV